MCKDLNMSSAHTFELVKQVLRSEKVSFLSHLPYSPDQAPFEDFLLVVVKRPDIPLAYPSLRRAMFF